MSTSYYTPSWLTARRRPYVRLTRNRIGWRWAFRKTHRLHAFVEPGDRVGRMLIYTTLYRVRAGKWLVEAGTHITYTDNRPKDWGDEGDGDHV